MNEGHAAFMALERIGHLRATKGMTFDEALEATRAGVARKPLSDIEREALEILLQLGERLPISGRVESILSSPLSI